MKLTEKLAILNLGQLSANRVNTLLELLGGEETYDDNDDLIKCTQIIINSIDDNYGHIPPLKKVSDEFLDEFITLMQELPLTPDSALSMLTDDHLDVRAYARAAIDLVWDRGSPSVYVSIPHRNVVKKELEILVEKYKGYNVTVVKFEKKEKE